MEIQRSQRYIAQLYHVPRDRRPLTHQCSENKARPAPPREKKAQFIQMLDGIRPIDFWQIVCEAGYPLQTMASDQK